MSEAVHFLVVSKRAALGELIRFVLEWKYDCRVATMQSESAALEYLRQIDQSLHMIIYDYEPDAFLVEDFIVYIKENFKQVNFLVLAEKIFGPSAQFFDQFPTFFLVKKEHIWQKVFDLSLHTFGMSLVDATTGFCRIHLNGLEALNGVAKDLYIKLPSGKLVRILSGEHASPADLEKYKAKGVNYLWLERATCDWIVDQLQTQFHIFLSNKNFQFILRGPELDAAESFDQKIIRISDELHLDPKFKKEIEMVMEKVMETVSKDIRIGRIIQLIQANNPSVSYFAKNLQIMSIISCFLAKKMEWHSKTTLDKLVYASVLHDITLATKPHLQRLSTLQEFESIKSTLTDEDQKLFLQHPREASQLIKSHFKQAPPETDVLVLQHHEMPYGKGFPTKTPAEKLSPLSQLFIVTQDFARFIMNEPAPHLEMYFLRAETRFEQHIFRRFINLLRKFKQDV